MTLVQDNPTRLAPAIPGADLLDFLKSAWIKDGEVRDSALIGLGLAWSFAVAIGGLPVIFYSALLLAPIMLARVVMLTRN